MSHLLCLQLDSHRMLLEMHLLCQPKQKNREAFTFLETVYWQLLNLKMKNNAPDDREQILPLLFPHVLVRIINSILDSEEETLNQPLL